MSRTYKGGKPLTYEFWSARPGNKHGGCIDAYAKKSTHKRERLGKKRELFSVDINSIS